MITIHVLAGGELFQHVLNAIATFMKQDGFLGLLRITALIGIVMATVGFLKTRDPMAFARWFLGYVLFVNIVLDILILIGTFGMPFTEWVTTVFPSYLVVFYGLYLYFRK